MNPRSIFSSMFDVYFWCCVILGCGCQCSTNVRNPVNEIELMIAQLEDAGKRKSIEGIMEHLAEDYSGAGALLGGGRSNFRRGLQMIFLRQHQVHLLIHVRRIDINPSLDQAEIKLLVAAARTKLDLSDINLSFMGDVLAVNAALAYKSRWRVKTANWKRVPAKQLLDELQFD